MSVKEPNGGARAIMVHKLGSSGSSTAPHATMFAFWKILLPHRANRLFIQKHAVFKRLFGNLMAKAFIMSVVNPVISTFGNMI